MATRTNGSAAPTAVYAIAKSQDVMAALESVRPSRQMEILHAIDALQFNPRPDGHELLDQSAPGLTKLLVEGIPVFLLFYTVLDDQRRVSLWALQELKFQR